MEQPVKKPTIVCTPGTCGGKPRVAGTRIRVQDIAIRHLQHGCSPEEIRAAFPHLTMADIHAALAYYFDHREEIERQIKESEEFADRMRRELGPGPLEIKLNDQDGPRAPLSS
jgi:uncharacterized protein (DUF433 family)